MSFPGDEERQNWLVGLKAGDEVAVECRTNGVRKEKVLKRTPTGIIVTSWVHGELRFDRFGNEKTSDPWHHRHLRTLTQVELDKIERQSLLRWVAGVMWGTMPLATLRKVREAAGG